MAPQCENAITYEGAVELLLSNRFVEAESTFKKVRRKCDVQGGAKRVGEFALGGFGLIELNLERSRSTARSDRSRAV